MATDSYKFHRRQQFYEVKHGHHFLMFFGFFNNNNNSNNNSWVQQHSSLSVIAPPYTSITIILDNNGKEKYKKPNVTCTNFACDLLYLPHT